MKRYKGKEIQVKVEPFSHDHYCIFYREKKKFNMFNFWKQYCYTFSIGLKSPFFDPNQPHLFEEFESALKTAQRLKSNPELIDENNERRWKKYNDLLNQDKKYRKDRNRSITL